MANPARRSGTSLYGDLVALLEAPEGKRLSEPRALPPEERELDVLDEAMARVSPLKHANLTCLGRYSCAVRPPHEGVRPLRDPATVHLDEDDEGTSD
ncbi:hypothetical protein [Streptomyces cellulosae]|uniref:Transposase n=1 Tax=Streptomyces cellulosae TaxID=1968 RepID=A0ABW7YHB9_STRCE